MFRKLLALIAFAAATAAPAMAHTMSYTAALSGHTETSNTGSKATAFARISADTHHQTINLQIIVTGLKIADLKDSLRGAPMGPIHLHNYLPNGDVVLVLPAPFGPSYRDTASGFTVTINDADYTASAKLVNSRLPFADFLKAMDSGKVVLNIHTNQFGDGEISGKVVSAGAKAGPGE